MGKQLSRALETRLSVSGTHFKNARVARRVARAGLTTGGSSDDTMDDGVDDLRLKLFLRRLSWPLFLFFYLVLWILALRSDIHFSYPPHLRSGPCNIQSHAVLPKPPSLCTHPICTPQSHSHDTHIHFIQYTPRMRRFSFAFTLFHPAVSVSSHPFVPSRFVLHSLFPVCSDRFALILFVFCFSCSRIVSPSLCSCFGH